MSTLLGGLQTGGGRIGIESLCVGAGRGERWSSSESDVRRRESSGVAII